MSDVRRLHALAAGQHNRVARTQLLALGVDPRTIERQVAAGRLLAAGDGVFAFPPHMDDDQGRWMAATLTAPGSFLALTSAATAHGFWDRPRRFETVVRRGSGGPRRFGDILVLRSSTLAGNTTLLGSIPATTAERTLIDLAPHVSRKDLARALREAVRLGRTTLPDLADAMGRHAGRRGLASLGALMAAYSGLPLDRARSGAEVRALLVLRDAGFALPELNHRVAGEEADLVRRPERIIVEVDGKPFHLDAGEDARKEAVWRAAGWDVRRIDSRDVYERPQRLLDLVPELERP